MGRWVTLICDKGHVVEVPAGYCGGCPECADKDHIHTSLKWENTLPKVATTIMLVAIAILAAYENMPHHR